MSCNWIAIDCAGFEMAVANGGDGGIVQAFEAAVGRDRNGPHGAIGQNFKIEFD